MKKKTLFLMLFFIFLYSIACAAQGDKVWDFYTEDWVLSSPAVSGDYVYVGSEDYYVYCLNADNGTMVWEFETREWVDSSPAVSGGYVYVGDFAGWVYCLDKATGALVWEFETGAGASIYSSPAVSGGYVYVGNNFGNVHCLNASPAPMTDEEREVWKYDTRDIFDSSPAVSGGHVYIGSSDYSLPYDNNKVYCLNAATGLKVWDYTTGGDVYSSPAVSGNRVYVGSLDGKVYCLNAATGLKVWDYTTGGDVYSSPAVSGGHVYVGSNDGKVYCLNAATGAKVWDYDTGGEVWYSSPAVTENYVYVGSDFDVYCLNAATGAYVWNYATGDFVDSSPAVSDGYVYVGSWDGWVYCLNAADGDSGSWPMFKKNNARTGAAIDTDNDGIPDDGDSSGTAGDNPCTGGSTENCDDNCPTVPNPNQDDTDSNGVGNVCDIALIEDLITHYYSNILGRAPDSGGLTYWTGEIMRLSSLGVDIKEGFISLAKNFFNYPEYLDRDRDDEEYVTDLYNTFFDREPDPGGLTYWTTELANGVSRNLILNYFVFSDEFNDYMEQIFGVSETRPENNMVNDYYRGLLSRIPGNEGFNYWLERFRDEQCYGDAESIRALALEIASGFIYTSEYTNRNRDDLGYIEDIYDAFMRRGGDSGGVNHFLTGLGDGTYTRDELLQIFVNSPEFQGRVQDVIDAGVDDIECPIRYTISGTVTGDVQDGVTITLTGDDSDTTTTDLNGDYSFTGLSNGSYIVTPSKSGYTFDPTYKNVTISLGSKTGINFISSDLNCAPGCFDSLLGDGECDDDCNVSACDYDDGDCEDCAPGCYDFMLGDGECNDECDFPECNFDDFDC